MPPGLGRRSGRCRAGARCSVWLVVAVTVVGSAPLSADTLVALAVTGVDAAAGRRQKKIIRFNFCLKTRPITARPAMPPKSACSIMLPVPASR